MVVAKRPRQQVWLTSKVMPLRPKKNEDGGQGGQGTEVENEEPGFHGSPLEQHNRQ